jgi:protoporphyrin/coproporphyrin ferrochelatase
MLLVMSSTSLIASPRLVLSCLLSVPQALDEAQHDGITNYVILPLYPHYSISTSGSSLKELQELVERSVLSPLRLGSPHLSRKGLTFNHTVIPYWHRRPGYLHAMADLIAQKYDLFSDEEKREGVHILFRSPHLPSCPVPLLTHVSAHGVPVSYIKSGDPYKGHIEECAQLISQSLDKIVNQPEQRAAIQLPGTIDSPTRASLDPISLSLSLGQEPVASSTAELNPITCELSFQSRVGPVEWLRPYTDQKIEEMGSRGVKNLIVVPISFVSEHIETLEEIDIEYKSLSLSRSFCSSLSLSVRTLALESGIKHWERASALNSNPLSAFSSSPLPHRPL